MSSCPDKTRSRILRHMRAMALLVWLGFGLLSAASLCAATDGVAVVYFGSGLIYEVGNGQWVERDLNGKPRGRYVEIRRTTESIVLEDPQTQRGRELNIGYGYIFFVEPDGAKTPVHQIASTKSASEAEYHRVNTRIDDRSLCLESIRRTFDVPSPSGTGTVMMQRYDPEFVECNESISQRWSIRRVHKQDGKTHYLWRSQRAELAGLDICLSSLGRNGVLAMRRCGDARTQRWIHPRPDGSAISRLHTAADPENFCLVVKPPGLAAANVALKPKLTDQCTPSDKLIVPEIRLQRIVD